MEHKTIKSSHLLYQSRLVIAEIFYYLPDYPSLLQSFVWQNEDLPPVYPHLKQFIQFWNAQLDGKIHMVKIDTKKCFGGNEFVNACFDGTIH
jgi:uncharacterized protein Usg